MSRIIITMSRTIFFRLLAQAPEELQREAKEDVRRAIPALCFTEDDIRERLAQEELWVRMLQRPLRIRVGRAGFAFQLDQMRAQLRQARFSMRAQSTRCSIEGCVVKNEGPALAGPH